MSKPTDSEQVKEWAKSIGLFKHKETDDYYEYWSNKEIYRVDYEQLAFFYQAMVERDQQRLSAWTTERATYRRTWIPKADVLSIVLEALPKRWALRADRTEPTYRQVGYNECLDECRQAITAALGPDNSKIEE